MTTQNNNINTLKMLDKAGYKIGLIKDEPNNTMSCIWHLYVQWIPMTSLKYIENIDKMFEIESFRVYAIESWNENGSCVHLEISNLMSIAIRKEIRMRRINSINEMLYNDF
jgi:hypothetical protein